MQCFWVVLPLLVCMSGFLNAATPESLGIDARPVPGKNLDYQPRPGEMSLTNPPAFRWVPAKPKSARYRLQVARDQNFRKPVYEARDLEYRIEVPTRPFEPGSYFWRYGMETSDGVVWSCARAFSISPDAGIFPYPEPGYTERISARRPRLFVQAEDLPDLRRRARTGEFGKITQSLLKRVHSYIGEKLAAEPPFLPKDKSRMAVYAVIYRTTRPTMDQMEQAARAYLLTGDRRAGLEAKRRLLHFFSWDPNGSTSLANNDEPAMWLMMRGVRTYDWTYDLYTPEERQKIEEVMLERTRQFYELLRKRPFDSDPFGSHAGRIVGFMGEAAIELIPEHPEEKKYLDYALRIYYGAYPNWGGPEGGWSQGVHYWFAYMDFILHFVVAVNQAIGLNFGEKPFFKNTPYFLYYSAPPFAQRRVFGDGPAAATPRRYGNLVYVFSLLNRDGRLKYYGQAARSLMRSGIMTMVLQDNFPAVPPTDLPTSRLFADVGLAVLRNTLTDGANHVGMKFHANPYGNVSHNHNDQNAFAIEAFGEPLAVPTGYYNYYDSPHHDQWTRSTRAKCTITIDGGRGQDRGPQATGKITDFVDSETFTLTSGDATPAYGRRLSKAIRDIVFLKPAGVFIIRDELAAPEPHRFEYWLHALEPMEVSESDRTVVIRRPKAAMPVRFLKPESLTFRTFSGFDPPVGEQATPDMVDQFHLTAVTAPVRETEFLSVLTPVKTGARPPTVTSQSTLDATRIDVMTADGRRYRITFAVPGHTLPGGSCRFMAEEIDSTGRTVAELRADGIHQSPLPPLP